MTEEEFTFFVNTNNEFWVSKFNIQSQIHDICYAIRRERNTFDIKSVYTYNTNTKKWVDSKKFTTSAHSNYIVQRLLKDTFIVHFELIDIDAFISTHFVDLL